MNVGENLRLENPPIVEAIVDIDCDFPPGLGLEALASRPPEVFADRYPKFRPVHIQQHEFKSHGEAPPEFSVRRGIQALQFWTEDDRQLIQIRLGGFSFNRLAPYTSLDKYLAEIERCWHLFTGLVEPSQIRRISLRYVNRILLPTVDGLVDLGDYLALSPRLADEETLQFIGFVDQHSVREMATNHLANVILVMQELDGEKLPLIFDIEVMHIAFIDPGDWQTIGTTITSLRRLKNLIFGKTLTEKCLNLYRQ